MSFEVFKRPPTRRRGAANPRLSIAKNRGYIYLNTPARALLGLAPGELADAVLLFDAERSIVGVRIEERGDYRIPKSGGISCADFLASFRARPGNYAATMISATVLSAFVQTDTKGAS